MEQQVDYIIKRETENPPDLDLWNKAEDTVLAWIPTKTKYPKLFVTPIGKRYKLHPEHPWIKQLLIVYRLHTGIELVMPPL